MKFKFKLKKKREAGSVALTGLDRFLLVEDPAHARMGWAIFSRPVGAGGGTGGFDIFSPRWGGEIFVKLVVSWKDR